MKYFLLILILTSCSFNRIPTLKETVKIKTLIAQAREKLISGDLQAAESFIDFANEINPNDVIVVDAYGCLYWYRNQYEIAERYFRSAILINPNFENTYVNLAFVLENQGKKEEAKNLLLYVLKLNPLNYRARNNYAALLNDKELAKEEFSKAIIAAPKIDFVLEYNQTHYQ